MNRTSRKRIKEDSSAQSLLFDPRFLEQYTGRALLHEPTIAIVELVANAWDAGSTKVEIDWPTKSGESVRVQDFGIGMTEDEFVRRWRTLSYDRVKEQGATVRVVSKPELPPRYVFGRNGVGRFAAFCFGSTYTVTTAAKGKRIKYRVSRGLENPIQLDKVSEGKTEESGTIIEVKQDGSTPLLPDVIRSELGKRFLTDPMFQVSVNSVLVDFEDIDQEGVEEFFVEIPSLSPIRILTIDTQKTDRTTKQHGVAWHVNGRLVGKCVWDGNGFDDLVDGRRIQAKRYTFIVFADCLMDSDAVKPDWSGFNRENDLYKKVLENVSPAIRGRLLNLTKDRRDENTREVRRANADNLRAMTPLSREKWNQFVDQAQETCPSLSQQELQNLSGVLANLEVSHSRYGLIRKLRELNPSQLDDLHKILEDWTIDMAKIVLDELEMRLKLIDELQERTSKADTLEVQELQPLFYRGLWIFGPEFETIEFTSNEAMTSVIQKLFDAEISGSRNRPDFAILPDSSVGLYSYDKYDDHGAEVCVDRLVIVELKKPGVTIGEEQKGQCWKYVKELYSKGLLTDSTRVECYVLGSQIDQNECNVRTEKDGRVRIQPLHFGTVLNRAKSRLLKLYDKVKTAPFLKNQDIQSYLSDPVEEGSQLSFQAK
jgi:hypothetical protein